MAEKETTEELSPEEKLLKVIQSEDKTEESEASAAETAVEENNSTTVTDDETAGDTQPDDEPPASSEPAIASVEKASGSGGTFSPVVFIRTIAALIIVMLAFSAAEIWGAVQNAQSEKSFVVTGGTAQNAFNEAAFSPSELPALAPVLSSISENRFLRRPGETVEIKTVVVENNRAAPPPPPPADWQKYAKENLVLKGLSRLLDGSNTLEAIVNDENENRMHFLKTGQTILLENVEVEITAIKNDTIELSDGKARFILK